MTTLIVFLLTFVASMLIVGSRLRRTDALHRHERAMAVLRDMTVDPEVDESDRFHVRIVRGPLPPADAAKSPARHAYAGNPSRSQAAASAARRSHVARAAAAAGLSPDEAVGSGDGSPAPPPPIRLRIDGLDELPPEREPVAGNGRAAGSNGVDKEPGTTAPGAASGSPSETPAAPPASTAQQRSPGAASRAPLPALPARVRRVLAGSARRTAVAAAAALIAAIAFSASFDGGGGGGSDAPVARKVEPQRPAPPPPTSVPVAQPAAKLVGFDGQAVGYAVPARFHLEIGALDRCWVRIESATDGSRIFEGILAGGETRAFDVTSPVSLRLGNAPVVGMSVDGAPLQLPPGVPTTLTLRFAPPA